MTNLMNRVLDLTISFAVVGLTLTIAGATVFLGAWLCPGVSDSSGIRQLGGYVRNAQAAAIGYFGNAARCGQTASTDRTIESAFDTL